MKKVIYSNQTFNNMEIKSITDNEVVIIGYASVYNIADHHNDLISVNTGRKMIQNFNKHRLKINTVL
ncbi:MAG: hypothetical protein LN546_03455 [Rickettsia endosymbiont of Ecitomorpha arachnoides]|nr:hypothetical protein [Rickettsia endosymbiont of Ecitomorpha arachnoides]